MPPLAVLPLLAVPPLAVQHASAGLLPHRAAADHDCGRWRRRRNDELEKMLYENITKDMANKKFRKEVQKHATPVSF